MWTKARQLVLGVAILCWLVATGMLIGNFDTFAAVLLGIMLVGLGFGVYAEKQESKNGST